MATVTENTQYREDDRSDPQYLSLQEVEIQGKNFMKNVQKLEYRGIYDKRYALKTVGQVSKDRKKERDINDVLSPVWWLPSADDQYMPMKYM
jgi:hypothetical protein